MPDETLSVRDDGEWKTVKFPYVYDTNLSSHQVTDWKKIHKVWVYDGGTWKVGHRTNWDDYTLQDTHTWYEDHTYTVPAGIKYLEVTIIGQGGGGGGKAGASSHYSCVETGGVPNWQPPSNSWHSHTAQGTTGGAGGKAYAVFEVAVGAVYYVENEGKPPGGDAHNQTMSNSGSPSHSAGNNWTADPGSEEDIVFNTQNAEGKTVIGITVTGGTGGNPGKLTVDRACYNFGGTQGYNLSGSYAGTGGSSVSDSSASISVSSGSTETQTITVGGGRAGGAPGTYSGDGSAPATSGSAPADEGYVEVKEWGYSTS